MANCDQDYEEEQYDRPIKKSNTLPIYGNEKSMNLNSLILTNIQSSQYFKVNLYKLKTYHEVLDEIYYKVNHLEPWEKGSRKTSGQTGMCGGVRGVGAGGIVSTAFCILYKLFTLKLTRKQVLGLMNHADSPYIRGLGFMYIRFTQPPADLWEWFADYLEDEEEVDVRAGGGQPTTIGAVVRHMLTKLDWYATLFPRIPVPIQKDLEKKLSERAPPKPQYEEVVDQRKDRAAANGADRFDHQTANRDRKSVDRERHRRASRDRDVRSREQDKRDRHSREKDRKDHDSRDKDRRDHDSRDKDRRDHDSRDKDRKDRDSRDKDRRDHDSRLYKDGRDRRDSRERDRKYNKDKGRDRHRRHDFSNELEREKERIKRDKRRSKSRSRSKERKRKHHY